MYLTYDDVAKFQREGYILMPDLFTPHEVATMLEAVEHGERVKSTEFSTTDSTGKNSRVALWSDLIDDLWSAVSTCPRIVNNARILMGEDVSFFHGKIMLKEAHTGGSWEWHQDYGYWYDQGFLFPHMMSVFIALDPSVRENGCLRVLKGSHKMGRLTHQKVGTQTGADPSRIAAIEQMFELVECEMSPGTALFFHSNLLHSSLPNDSDHHRRTFVTTYYATSNPKIVDGKLVHTAPCPVGDDGFIVQYTFAQ